VFGFFCAAAVVLGQLYGGAAVGLLQLVAHPVVVLGPILLAVRGLKWVYLEKPSRLDRMISPLSWYYPAFVSPTDVIGLPAFQSVVTSEPNMYFLISAGSVSARIPFQVMIDFALSSRKMS
jgi:hypothetical protein